MIGFNQVLIVLNLRVIKDGEGLCIDWKSEIKCFNLSIIKREEIGVDC